MGQRTSRMLIPSLRSNLFVIFPKENRTDYFSFFWFLKCDRVSLSLLRIAMLSLFPSQRMTIMKIIETEDYSKFARA